LSTVFFLSGDQEVGLVVSKYPPGDIQYRLNRLKPFRVATTQQTTAFSPIEGRIVTLTRHPKQSCFFLLPCQMMLVKMPFIYLFNLKFLP
jgi:hypothetical protein